MRKLFLILLLLSLSYALKLSHSLNLESHNEIIKAASKEEFDNLIHSRGPIIAFFTGGAWCTACNYFIQTIKKFSAKYPNIPVVIANVEDIPELGYEWNAFSLPTTVSIKKDGAELGRIVGVQQYAVEKLFININK